MLNKLKNIVLITAMITGSMLSSCWILEEAPKQAADTHEKQGFTKATITILALDGCKWMIALEEGKGTLEPINLSEEFRKENLKVWIQYESFKEGASICMAGEMVKITAIEIRK